MKGHRFTVAIVLVTLLVAGFVLLCEGVSPVTTFATMNSSGKITPAIPDYNAGYQRVFKDFILLVVPVVVVCIGFFYLVSRKLKESPQSRFIEVVLKAVAIVGISLWTYFIVLSSAHPWVFGL